MSRIFSLPTVLKIDTGGGYLRPHYIFLTKIINNNNSTILNKPHFHIYQWLSRVLIPQTFVDILVLNYLPIDERMIGTLTVSQDIFAQHIFTYLHTDLVYSYFYQYKTIDEFQ